MTTGYPLLPDESFILAGDPDEFFCPVCGIELARANFDTPATHYYCPYCGTRQSPSMVRLEERPNSTR